MPMILHKESRKIYNSLKCEFPSNTIARIAEGFKKLRLSICYEGSRVSAHGISLYSGTVSIPKIGLVQNGKGRTKLEAKASAYAELAERFSAYGMDHCIPFSPHDPIERNYERRLFLPGAINRPRKTSNAVITPKSLLANKLKATKQLIEQLSTHELTRTHVDCIDMCSEQIKKIPINFVQFIARGNGLAAGNTYEEATSQAMCEVIERYVASRFLLHKEVAPNIDPRTIKDKHLRRYLSLFRKLGLSVIIKDLSFICNIPAICLITINKRLKKDPNPYRRQEYRRFSFGCALTREQALVRCLTEEFQGFDTRNYLRKAYLNNNFWSIWTNRIKELPKQNPNDSKIHSLQYDYLGDTSFAERSSGDISFSDLPSHRNDNAYDDVAVVKGALKELKRDIYVVDFTHPVLNFPVVHVVVPGMSDVIDFYYPEWINEKCIPAKSKVATMPYMKLDLTQHALKSAWTKSRGGIRDVLDALESKFVLFGNADAFQIEQSQVWPFYLAYRLSLFLEDPHNSMRYLAVIRKTLPNEADILLSRPMEHYFKSRCSGMDKKTSLAKLGKKYGRTWKNRISTTLNEHDIRYAEPQNPFIPRYKNKSRLHQLIKSYFK